MNTAALTIKAIWHYNAAIYAAWLSKHQLLKAVIFWASPIIALVCCDNYPFLLPIAGFIWATWFLVLFPYVDSLCEQAA